MLELSMVLQPIDILWLFYEIAGFELMILVPKNGHFKTVTFDASSQKDSSE
jgi:hypothetical protein